MEQIEKLSIFLAATVGLEKYLTNGYCPIGVYVVKQIVFTLTDSPV